jgi:hypothetical protein
LSAKQIEAQNTEWDEEPEERKKKKPTTDKASTGKRTSRKKKDDGETISSNSVDQDDPDRLYCTCRVPYV